MTYIEYIYRDNNIIHALVTKPSVNSKLGLGYVMMTYHFSVEQVENIDITLDRHNCKKCPLSYTNNKGKSGGCYTHKGLQRFGIIAMMKRLNKLHNLGVIKEFNQELFDAYAKISKNIHPALLRLGTYGEPVLMSSEAIETLTQCARTYTGYTHMWRVKKYNKHNKFIMASTHSHKETMNANKKGFRAFQTGATSSIKMPVCPASKEFKGKRKTCIECASCNGNLKRTNNIFIKLH